MHATDTTAPPTHGARPVGLTEALRRLECEAEQGVCDTGRYHCPYYAWGDGPPLLFVPGLSDDRLSFVLPIALLSAHFRCIAYDMPTGRGDGARLAAYRHADLVADLFALLDHVGAARSYLFASSFGSTVALAALHARPERLPRAVLQGAFARRPLAPAEVLLCRFARYWPWSMRRLPLRRPLLERVHRGPFGGQAPNVWDYFLERWGAPPMAAVARRALILHGLDLRRLLPEIRQPVLLVCGDGDPLVGRACERVLLDGLPDVTRAELTGCGHVPMFTHPDVLAEVVHRFLTPLPCATGGRREQFEPTGSSP